MTQKIFCNKFCPTFDMLLFTLRKNLGFTAVATALALILSPFYMMNLVENQLEYYVTEKLNFQEIFFPAAIILAVGATLFLVILLYINFSFLFSKSASDAFHSMPISRTKMLLSRFFASYISSLVPVIAAYIGFVAVSFSPSVEANVSAIITAGLFTVFMMLFCGAFALLFIITAGTVFDSVVAFAALNVGLPVIVALICSMCEDNLYGVASIDYVYAWQYTSPFTFSLIKFLAFLEEPLMVNPFAWGTTVPVILLTAVIMIVSILLYHRRKCETAGTAYAYKFVPVIIGTVVSVICYFILGAIFANDRISVSFWIPGVIGAVLGAVIYNVVINRGFKNIKRAVAPVSIALVFIFTVTAGIALDVFGFEDYVPEKSDIANVNVNYRGMSMNFDDIELATDLHKLIVRDKPERSYRETYSDYEYLHYTYTLRSGETVERRYFVPFTFATAEKAEIIKTELTNELERQFEEYGGNEFSLDGNVAGKYINVTLNHAEGENLVRSYIADLKNADTRQLFREEYNSIDTIHIYGSWADAKPDEYDYKSFVSYSSFSFSFRNDKEYINFQRALSEIDIEARNRAVEK